MDTWRARLASALVGAALVASCAPLPNTNAPDVAGRCEHAYRALDDAVEAAGVHDAMSARVAGFPYLRLDRLHASFAPDALDGPRFDDWRAALMREDTAARLVEVANLPPAPTAALRRVLAEDGFAQLPPSALLEGCAKALAERDRASASRRAELREAARVPDDYSDAQRAAGLYWLTAPAFAVGVRRSEDGVRERFAREMDAAPAHGVRTFYAPADAGPPPESLRALVRAMPRDALGIPRPSPEALDALFGGWAPRFAIDDVDANDRIGMPVLGGNDRAEVDTRAPVVFTRAAATRFDGRVLLQLVYTAWFPARVAQRTDDPLAGHLDGLVWRVTLDADGEPLVFDSMHPSGSFHLFVPTARLAEKPAPPTLDQGALVPQRLPAIPAGARVTLRVSAGAHELQRVDVSERDESSTRYSLAPEDRLRTLARPGGGTRSLYGPDGIVLGTQRDERWWRWPLGIESPGAMRQWGRHATAFIGRRHFDEAFLIERYFARAPGGSRPVAADGKPAATIF